MNCACIGCQGAVQRFLHGYITKKGLKAELGACCGEAVASGQATAKRSSLWGLALLGLALIWIIV